MNYARLADELRRQEHDVDLIADLADISRFVARVTHGDVQIGVDAVRWRGKPVHGVVVDRLLAMLRTSTDLTPLANFLDRLMQNPSQTAQDELFLWLESGSQPITPEGNILAFKHVENDYLDHHTRSISNAVGAEPSMPREQVDPDRDRTCSRGLHFCSAPYLSAYSGSENGHVMILEVDPADVVAIPSDYSNQKGRAWRYKVVGEVPHEDAALFFEGHPVVETYSYADNSDDSDDSDDLDDADDLDDSDDLDNSEREAILLGDTVIFVGTEDDAENSGGSMHVGGAYVVDALSDNHNEIGFYGDERVWTYADISLFQLESAIGDILPTQAEGKAPLLFTSGGRSFLAEEVLSMVSEHGQRGFNRITGVPRSTLQGWLAAIDKQNDA